MRQRGRKYGLSRPEFSSVEQLSISNQIWEELCGIADRSDIEVCGGLFGKVIGKEIKIFGWKQCQNTVPEIDAFTVDIDELYSHVEYHEEKPLRLLGLFHSHPDGEPSLSPMDMHYLNFSSFLWTIMGKVDGKDSWEIKAFAKKGLRPREIPIVNMLDRSLDNQLGTEVVF